MRQNPVYGSRPTLMEPQGHVRHNRDGVFQVVHVPHKSAQLAVRPTLLELVPPPSPFAELWYSGLRALPLRVVVPFGDCGDAPGASAHYLGPCLGMSVPNTSSSPSPKASSKTYHQLGLRSTTWGIALACQSPTPRRRRRQKSVVKTYHQLGLRPFYPPLLPPLPQLHRSV
jgi:hypothetical protein